MHTRSIVTHLFVAALGITLVAGLATGRASNAAQPGDLNPNDPKAIQAAEEAWMKSIQPGKQHEFLKQFVGEWTTTTRMFMAPGAPPMEVQGTASLSMIHGERFLKQDFAGNMAMPGPDGKVVTVPWTGLGVTGYDNNRKLFSFSWTDSMSTGIILGSGALSKDGKTITCFGQMDEPMTGEMGKAVRFTTRAVANDTWTFQIDEVVYGDPFKVVEVEYKRKK